MTASPAHPSPDPVTTGVASGSDSLLVRAALGHPVPRPPVWFMRQAGRSLPEYRKLREGIAMLDSCRRPDLVTEITLQPVRRHGVDAAIFFSDIVVPLSAVGVGVEIVAGVGPVVAEPVRTMADVDRIPELDPGMVPDITESVSTLVRELGGTPLIGFAGAPFTLASYLVEGGPSRTHAKTKALMHGEPDVWDALCRRLAQISGTFLQVQAAAGASAVQLFDSWVGALPRTDYVRFVQPHSAAVLAQLKASHDVPAIHFGVGTGELLTEMGRAGADVVGVDFRVELRDAIDRLGPNYSVQGNLDPALLGAPWPVIEAAVRRIVSDGRAARGHIVNLGHGVPPDADPHVLTRIVELVHSLEDSAPEAAVREERA